jgi:DNA-binding MarR family transcriptional regulator
MDTTKLEQKLDKLIELSLHSLVFSMYKSGHTMDEICKNLHIAKPAVVKILGGLSKGKAAK